jgi:hypothetical protein
MLTGTVIGTPLDPLGIGVFEVQVSTVAEGAPVQIQPVPDGFARS